MWHGRFNEAPDELMRVFSQSVSFDRRLWREDIEGSLAYAEELARVGVLSAKELAAVTDGLRQIAESIEQGEFEFSTELEDIHMNIEARLTELVGEAGKKLHTGRSRNDQVATSFRLWCARRAEELSLAITSLAEQIVARAEETVDVIIPAYTHLQRAMPVRLAHHLLAWLEMLARDHGRVRKARDQALAACPLGSGAATGNSFGVDMARLAKGLGFEAPAANSMDAVSDRDFALDLAYGCSLCMVHLSRIAEDLILWSSSEFGFIELGDAVTTGSSIMPQKRNPDACELVRGKAGRAIGSLVGLLTMLKGQPLTYNRDNQEDKEAVFDASDQALASL
ncbi:MAG: argininosuccinate lyase, partial [Nitrospira sp.]|nr:argininosuccinate lyase [Nitrospira sp.]